MCWCTLFHSWAPGLELTPTPAIRWQQREAFELKALAMAYKQTSQLDKPINKGLAQPNWLMQYIWKGTHKKGDKSLNSIFLRSIVDFELGIKFKQSHRMITLIPILIQNVFTYAAENSSAPTMKASLKLHDASFKISAGDDRSHWIESYHGEQRELTIYKPLACWEIELSFLVTIVAPFAFNNFGSRETCHAVNGNVDWKFGVVFRWSKKIGN